MGLGHCTTPTAANLIVCNLRQFPCDQIFHNRSDEYKAKFLTSRFQDYGVDAVVYHDGRTSPELSNVRYGLEVQLKRKTGLPSLVIEADTHDLRLFSLNQIQRQLTDFIEQQEWAPTAGQA